MVSGDVAYRIVYILAFIGAAPVSVVGLLFAEETVSYRMLMNPNFGESNTIVVLAAVAAVFVFAILFVIVRYPVSRESVLGLWVGLLCSALGGIILWGWLTLKYEYELPLLHISEFYTIATLTFLDFLLAAMAILVVLMAATDRM